MSSPTGSPTGDPGRAGEAGDDLASAAVAAMASTGFVRAAADAMELQAVATLARLRRHEALGRARASAREQDRARGLVPGTTRPAAVDHDRVDRFTSQEVSLALTLSPVVARDRLELALELVERRPVTFEALRSGRIDLVRARRICDAVRTVGGVDHPTVAAQVEAEALVPGSVPALADRRPARPAGDLTPAQLGTRLARLVLRADPAGATERTGLADARRGCSLRVLPDGMALLSVTGRAELLGAAFRRLDATARDLLRADGRGRVDDAARTLDQTRVDVLLATLLGDSHDLTRAHNVRVDLALVATAGTVLGGGDEPGDLDGVGFVPAPLARALAADARWRRWATDPETGHVTATAPRPGTGGQDHGCRVSTDDPPVDPHEGLACGCGVVARHRTYRPTAAVADLIRARDRTCRFPTCRRRAEACDLDHVTPFPDGPTCSTTMATECRLHHRCKHQGGFSLAIAPDGTTTWTTPTGRRVTTHPPSWGRPPPQPDGPPGPGGPDPSAGLLGPDRTAPAAGPPDDEPPPF